MLPATTTFPLSLPHTLPLWPLPKVINHRVTDAALEAEGLRDPGKGRWEAIPGFLGRTGAFSAPLGKSSVVISTASPWLRVLAVLAVRERGCDLLIQGTRGPAVLVISGARRRGQAPQHPRTPAMPSACPGGLQDVPRG